MPPNTIDVPMGFDDTIRGPNTMDPKANIQPSSANYGLQIFQSSVNLLAHILVGCVLAISLAFAFRAGLPLNATNLHIVLCVVGYQLLMAEAILSLSPENGWSAKLSLTHRKRAHWILQLAGSLLAIVGSFIKIVDKSVHWNSLHGQFALVALVFTSVSLINGLTSLWAFELRRFLPGNVSKLTHICFGTVAFAASCIALCYGFEKNFFRIWSTDSVAYTIISFTAILTLIVIVNPLLSFYQKSRTALKRL